MYSRCQMLRGGKGVTAAYAQPLPEVSKVSYLSKLSPISIYVIILITFPPVLGKRMSTLPSAMSTLITLPPRSSP
jgi:hypothetical protein